MSGSGTTSAVVAETIFTYPPLGIRVTTDGNSNNEERIRIVNDSGATVEVGDDYHNTIHVVSSGETYTTPDLTGSHAATYVLRQSSGGDPKRGLVIICGFDFAPDVANCVGFGIG